MTPGDFLRETLTSQHSNMHLLHIINTATGFYKGRGYDIWNILFHYMIPQTFTSVIHMTILLNP